MKYLSIGLGFFAALLVGGSFIFVSGHFDSDAHQGLINDEYCTLDEHKDDNLCVEQKPPYINGNIKIDLIEPSPKINQPTPSLEESPLPDSCVK